MRPTLQRGSPSTMGARCSAIVGAAALAGASDLGPAPPACIVALDGHAGYVSTEVDVQSPGHGSRWPVGAEIALRFAVALDPPGLAADDRLVVCVALDGGAPSCAPLGDLAPAPLPPLPAAGGPRPLKSSTPRSS